MSFNKITVLGNLTRNPELRYTSAGTPVCTVNLASNDRERNPKSGELESRPTFFKATAWGKQAETIAQHFERGAEIYLEGRFRPEEWTDREGRERITFGIQVANFNFTGGSKREPGRARPAVAAPLPADNNPLPPATGEDLGDDIPF
jgi:single-strand DNA-binding protein